MENQLDNIVEINIEEEMKKSYLAYSMSVIMSRALPDVRDGLKPVHRRILYSMDELNLGPDKSFRKSAKLVGDVLGNYHPHGEKSVYDAIVRMAQDFNSRYLLIEGHGNFGSIDGDGAAASRYTEARMTKLTLDMLRDIDKETVDFKPNYDETRMEPVVLPSRFPNLLVNGSSGIAVGMATNIPPHNLGETVDAIIHLIDNPEAGIDELNGFIKGPDFPTGANILGLDGIRSAYRTGRGKILVRSTCEIEEIKNGKYQLVFREIPYQVNKANLIEKIAELVRDKRIEGISMIRDESDREGMRIVIEIKRDANPNVVLNKLYKFTQLQNTFGVIMLAIVNGEPKVLNLRQMLQHYIRFQKEIIVRRTRFDLRKAEERDHIVVGLLKAIDHIDEIIRIIRSSYSDAQEKLMEAFDFTEIQAQAILNLQLRRLQGLEKEKLEQEHEELTALIRELKDILASDQLVYDIIKTELLEIKKKNGDDRRTRILPAEDEIEIEDIIQEENVVLTLTHFGYIKRTPESTYKTQKRGGKGITGLTTREEDFVEDIYITSTHDNILFFTDKGKVFSLKAYEIPEGSRTAKGTAVINLLNLTGNEKVRAIVPIPKDDSEGFLFFATKKGIIKKTSLDKYANVRKNGIIGIHLKDDDELISVRLTNGKGELMMVTAMGMAIRFSQEEIRDLGRNATGVIGVKIREGDGVVCMEEVQPEHSLLVISENGFGKRTPLEEYRVQNRGGMGIKTYRVTEKTGKLISAKVVHEQDEVLMISISGTIIRLSVAEISMMSRVTQGVTLMKTTDDVVVAVAKLVEED